MNLPIIKVGVVGMQFIIAPQIHTTAVHIRNLRRPIRLAIKPNKEPTIPPIETSVIPTEIKANRESPQFNISATASYVILKHPS